MQRIILYFLFWIIPNLSYTQLAPGVYLVSFTDKDSNGYTIDNPADFLSSKAIERRQKQNIAIDELDLPITSTYIDSLKKLGLKILNRSKWMNSVTVSTSDTLLMDTIHHLSFVLGTNKHAVLDNNREKKNTIVAKTEKYYSSNDSLFLLNYGRSEKQISLLKGNYLHNLGYLGYNINIAVIDAGFYRVDSLPAFQHLWSNNQIKGTYDFADGKVNVFQEHPHGMQVLSVIAGSEPGKYIGSAPAANFWLFRSEVTAYEYAIEGENWISAAEYADSAGIDIINTSLGYTTFDDTLQNYTYSDLDGNTARISIAAEIAASRGMLVIVSAGNHGSGSWQYISAPADAKNVLAVGATDTLGILASFSSIGPSSDGRIKPDIVAPGRDVSVLSPNGNYRYSNGTSYSAPIISGLAACLWQAFPSSSSEQIKDAIVKSADRYHDPDNFYGYGIPNFSKAYSILEQDNGQPTSHKNPLKVYPNPFTNSITIHYFTDGSDKLTCEVFDITGKKVYSSLKKTDTNFHLESEISNLKLSPGLYILKVSDKNHSRQTLIVKQ